MFSFFFFFSFLSEVVQSNSVICFERYRLSLSFRDWIIIQFKQFVLIALSWDMQFFFPNHAFNVDELLIPFKGFISLNTKFYFLKDQNWKIIFLTFSLA